MTKDEYLKSLRILDKHRLMAKSQPFDILIGTVSQNDLVDLLRLLGELEERKVVSYKNYLKKDLQMIGGFPSISYVDALSIFMDIHGYNNFVTEVRLMFKNLSYKYVNGEVKIYVDSEHVGSFGINSEVNDYYNYALKNPNKKISYDDVGKKSSIPFNKHFNTHEYYSSVLKPFFKSSNKNHVIILNKVQIDDEVEARVRRKLAK